MEIYVIRNYYKFGASVQLSLNSLGMPFSSLYTHIIDWPRAPVGQGLYKDLVCICGNSQSPSSSRLDIPFNQGALGLLSEIDLILIFPFDYLNEVLFYQT